MWGYPVLLFWKAKSVQKVICGPFALPGNPRKETLVDRFACLDPQTGFGFYSWLASPIYETLWPKVPLVAKYPLHL
jgi:hypothetical protein